jgi:hypothetical protein
MFRPQMAMVTWKAYFLFLLRKESMLYEVVNGRMIQAGKRNGTLSNT